MPPYPDRTTERLRREGTSQMLGALICGVGFLLAIYLLFIR